MKIMKKYFLALVPEGHVQELATSLKLEIREKFNVKYALKSPAHVTLKMPFIYNEVKEHYLIARIQDFVLNYKQFPITIGGVNTFGKRVIYWGVKSDNQLMEFQSSLKVFCRRELRLKEELSDVNFQPHVTLAFKDIKLKYFEDILKYIQERPIKEEIMLTDLTLLKKLDNRWFSAEKFSFKRLN